MRAHAVAPQPANKVPHDPPVAQRNNAINDARPVTTLGFWVALLILYFLWDVIVLRSRLRDTVEPGNIRTNLYNIFMIGMAAVIFINGMKVLLVKVAAWHIPGVSWLAAKLVPLFQL